MLVPNKNPKGYKERVISSISFSFGEGVIIIDWVSNVKLYLSNIEESYKDTIIGNMGNSGTAYLLIHIVQCWIECSVSEKNKSLPMILYYSHMMYTYYYKSLIFPNQTK